MNVLRTDRSRFFAATAAVVNISLLHLSSSRAEAPLSLSGQQWRGELAPLPGLEIVLSGREKEIVADFPQLGQAGYPGLLKTAPDGAAEIAIPTPIGEMTLHGKFAEKSFEGTWQF